MAILDLSWSFWAFIGHSDYLGLEAALLAPLTHSGLPKSIWAPAFCLGLLRVSELFRKLSGPWGSAWHRVSRMAQKRAKNGSWGPKDPDDDVEMGKAPGCIAVQSGR